MRIQGQPGVAQTAVFQALLVHFEQYRQAAGNALGPVPQKGVERKARMRPHMQPAVAFDQCHRHAAQPGAKAVVAQEFGHHQPQHRVSRQRCRGMAPCQHQPYLHHRQLQQQGRTGNIGGGRHIGDDADLLQTQRIGHGGLDGQGVHAQRVDFGADNGHQLHGSGGCGDFWRRSAQQVQH